MYINVLLLLILYENLSTDCKKKDDDENFTYYIYMYIIYF